MSNPAIKQTANHSESKTTAVSNMIQSKELSTKMQVGGRIRKLRNDRGLSLRSMAERSKLNINTLSLIENGKSSPSVGTLQALASALEVPITAFFESAPVTKQIVYTAHDLRPVATFNNAMMQNLGKDLAGNAVQPFVVTLDPGVGSGNRMIVHTGHEFVFCLKGSIRYEVDQKEFILTSGDSLVFEAHLPHCWKNNDNETAQILLILYPSDENEEPGGRHFSPEYMEKE